MIHATILGRLGRDPEVKHTASGQTVLSLNIATDHGYGDKKQTMWVRCSMFGDRGAKLADFLSKGSQVLVTGQLNTREWEKDGQKNISLELMVSQLEFAGSKGDSAPRQQEPQRQQEPARPAAALVTSYEDDDVPF